MESPKLSTMVVLYTTNLKFDTTLLTRILPLDEKIIKVEKKGIEKRGESSRDKIKHRTKKLIKPLNNTGFSHNSVTIVLKNNAQGFLPEKEITIKIFQNGVFHLTGVLDDKYDIDSMNIILHVLWKYCRECIVNSPETYEILNRRVVLMNYTTKLPFTIAREALHNAIRALGYKNIKSFYEPDVYPGVKIQLENTKWTAKVFRTGKIILTGITCSSDCENFMLQLQQLFELVLPTKH